MNIISLTANDNSAYNVQTWPGSEPPEGYAELTDSFYDTWEAYKPFVTPTFDEDNILTALVDNSTARETWEDEEEAAATASIVLDDVVQTHNSWLTVLSARIDALETTE